MTNTLQFSNTKYSQANLGDVVFEWNTADFANFVDNTLIPTAKALGFKVDKAELKDYIDDNYGYGTRVEPKDEFHKELVREWTFYKIFDFLSLELCEEGYKVKPDYEKAVITTR